MASLSGVTKRRRQLRDDRIEKSRKKKQEKSVKESGTRKLIKKLLTTSKGS